MLLIYTLNINSDIYQSYFNKIRNENGEIPPDNTKIQRNIRDYYQQLYANKMDNLEEMDKFLEKYNFSKKKHFKFMGSK